MVFRGDKFWRTTDLQFEDDAYCGPKDGESPLPSPLRSIRVSPACQCFGFPATFFPSEQPTVGEAASELLTSFYAPIIWLSPWFPVASYSLPDCPASCDAPFLLMAATNADVATEIAFMVGCSSDTLSMKNNTDVPLSAHAG